MLVAAVWYFLPLAPLFNKDICTTIDMLSKEQSGFVEGGRQGYTRIWVWETWAVELPASGRWVLADFMPPV